MAGIGPQLPPHLQKLAGREEEEAEEDPDDSEAYGPALPPGFSAEESKTKNKKIIGPSLPGQKIETGDTNDDDDEEEEEEEVGPCLPMLLRHESNDHDRIREEFEARADAMKNKLTGKGDGDKTMERESWMLELPPELSKNFGLGPRTFRANAPEMGDRSVWTDTPADVERKKNDRREEAQAGAGQKRKPEIKQLTAEEIEMQTRVQEYNKATRPQSLMEMHQEKRKKTEEPSVRRPFDRERDLALHRTDPKEKAKFIQNAKGFNSKFSSGNYENKFL